MAKVLPLEGPHKRHHDHGKDASVPAHTSTPKKHWEIQYNPLPPGKSTPVGAFDPKRSRDRPCMQNKVNETDH